ncbi:MAG: YraN family protein [Patescibacteria group bacterium]|nr:YraN family protein [Patescibacteria group bacterium]
MSNNLNNLNKNSLGKIGEDKACEYLVGKRFLIIERNFKRPWGELDIVAKAPDKTLVFVEVKTVTENNFQGISAEDQMTASKIKKFKKAAELYAGYRQDLIDDKKGWRLDVVALTKTANNFQINHYENI